MKNTNKFTAYQALNAIIDNDIIKFDFEVDTTEQGDVLGVTDNSVYQLSFAHNLKDAESHYTINDSIEDDILQNVKDIDNNYVAFRYQGGKENLLQFWGQANKGVVVIEVRKQTNNNLKLHDLKVFREWEKETKGGKEKDFCYVCKSVEDVTKFCKEFFKRFETKKKTSASEKEETSEKVG